MTPKRGHPPFLKKGDIPRFRKPVHPQEPYSETGDVPFFNNLIWKRGMSPFLDLEPPTLAV
jgi:hypothetical protein